jgi:hypothetical protein
MILRSLYSFRVTESEGLAMKIWGVLLCHCEDPDLSGDVAISGVICHETWGLLRCARNDDEGVSLMMS